LPQVTNPAPHGSAAAKGPYQRDHIPRYLRRIFWVFRINHFWRITKSIQGSSTGGIDSEGKYIGVFFKNTQGTPVIGLLQLRRKLKSPIFRNQLLALPFLHYSHQNPTQCKKGDEPQKSHGGGSFRTPIKGMIRRPF
jgi:hypothetical protein